MTNEIVKGIAAALHAAYPAQEIYQQSMEQGLVEPCFLIQLVDTSVSRLGTDRWRYLNNLDILWFPEDGGDNATMSDMAISLASVLEYIDTPEDGKVLATGIHWEIEDGTLHFYVSFNHIVRRTHSVETMESETIEINL